MESHKVAALETQVDHLETELSYLHSILLKCGFAEGLTTLKLTLEEMLQEKSLIEDLPEI